MPFMLAWVVSSTLGSRLALRLGYRLLAIAGMASLCTGAFVLAGAVGAPRLAHVLAAMALCGAGMGASFTPLLIGVQSAVPREELGVATSAVQFFRSIGGAIGVSILGAVLATTLAGGGLPPGLAPEDIIDPIARDRLDPAVLEAARGTLAAGLGAVFRAEFAIALVAFALSTLVPGGAAREHVHAPAPAAEV
jgi:hypothetical protein